jgi:threonine/homoserine/homoserine lactone efflux protein
VHPPNAGRGGQSRRAIYASIAAFGLTAASDLLVGERRPLGIVGGCFLVALAVHSLLSHSEATADRPPRTLLSAYETTVGPTIANPATVLSFAADGPRSAVPWARAI